MLVAVIGLSGVLEYAFGWAFRPDLMAPIAALNFLLTGLALLSLDWTIVAGRRRFEPAEFLAFAINTAASIALLDYVLRSVLIVRVSGAAERPHAVRPVHRPRVRTHRIRRRRVDRQPQLRRCTCPPAVAGDRRHSAAHRRRVMEGLRGGSPVAACRRDADHRGDDHAAGRSDRLERPRDRSQRP